LNPKNKKIVIQSHPIKLAFCEYLCRAAKKDHKINEQKKAALNKWNLAITLYKNPHLRKERKNFIQ
jgi:hypothetical protein